MKICQKCGHEIVCPSLNCPWCGCQLDPSFNIVSFLTQNIGLFTIIGIIGTLLTLLPIFSEILLGSTWLYDQTDYIIVPFVIAIEFGIFFLFAIFLIILSKMFDRWREEEKIFLFFRKGDIQRGIFCILFIPFCISLIFFMFQAISKIPNIVGNSFYLVSFLVTVLLIYGIIITKAGFQLGQDLVDMIMKKKYPQFVLMIILIIVAILLLSLLPTITPLITTPKHYPTNVSITVDQYYYSPTISKTNGIGITPTNLTRAEILPVKKRWTTTYGYILVERPPSQKIVIEGQDTIPENDLLSPKTNTVYWTFDSNDIGKDKPVTKIRLQLLDPITSKPVTNTTFRIEWETRDVAFLNISTVEMDVLTPDFFY